MEPAKGLTCININLKLFGMQESDFTQTELNCFKRQEWRREPISLSEISVGTYMKRRPINVGVNLVNI